MRVLHLTPEFPPVIWGGLGTAVGGLVMASAQAGITVGVLLMGGVLSIHEHGYGGWQPITSDHLAGGTGRVFLNPEGITFFHVASPDASQESISLVKQWQPDLIHVHSAWLWSIAKVIQQQTGIPIVFTVHSIDKVEYECDVVNIDWQHQEAVIEAASRVVAISESEQKLLMQHCPQATNRVRVVGNGIDNIPLAEQAVQNRQHTDPTSHAPLVMYSGRFVARKGIRELLMALPLVLAQAPDTRFVLVGGYGGGAEIERTWMMEALRPYQHQIHFTGWLTPKEVAVWYRKADILTIPSWYEPFGMVVLEGMLNGLAIAASNVGGPAEILQHGRTGLLFEPQDPEALADAILQFVQAPALRRQIGLAAADEVRSNWLWPTIVQKMQIVYQEVIHEP